MLVEEVDGRRAELALLGQDGLLLDTVNEGNGRVGFLEATCQIL